MAKEINNNQYHQQRRGPTTKMMIHFVSVDSRGRLPSDMSCYKELSCSDVDFKRNITNNSNYICVTSQVASLCGLDLHIYFNDHPYGNHLHYGTNFDDMNDIYYGGEDDNNNDDKKKKNKNEHHHHNYDIHRHYPHKEQLLSSSDSPSPLGRINGIATLLTFNPYTGYYNHIVRGIAYVLLSSKNNNADETSFLSKKQLCCMQQFIQEQKLNYGNKDNGQYSHEAKMELLTKSYEHMINGTFVKMGTPKPSAEDDDRHNQKVIHEEPKVFQMLSNQNYNEETAAMLNNKNRKSKNRNNKKKNHHSNSMCNPSDITFEFYNNLCHA